MHYVPLSREYNYSNCASTHTCKAMSNIYIENINIVATEIHSRPPLRAEVMNTTITIHWECMKTKI